MADRKNNFVRAVDQNGHHLGQKSGVFPANSHEKGFLSPKKILCGSRLALRNVRISSKKQRFLRKAAGDEITHTGVKNASEKGVIHNARSSQLQARQAVAVGDRGSKNFGTAARRPSRMVDILAISINSSAGDYGDFIFV